MSTQKLVLMPVSNFYKQNQVLKQVKALYRAKLRIACEMGYNLGSATNTDYIKDDVFDAQKLTHLARKRYCGLITWSNVNHQYKYTLNKLSDEYLYPVDLQDTFLDYGFEMLRTLNKLKQTYRDENKYRKYALAAKEKGKPLMIIPEGSEVWNFPSG